MHVLLKLCVLISGGSGLGVLEGCLLAEEIAYGCTGILTAITGSGLAAAPVLLGGSEEQKKKYIGRLTEEPIVAVNLLINN